eukprot:scaffold139514_cov23-Cyclotella_meneghiniana.AAC.1
MSSQGDHHHHLVGIIIRARLSPASCQLQIRSCGSHRGAMFYADLGFCVALFCYTSNEDEKIHSLHRRSFIR